MSNIKNCKSSFDVW